MSNIDIENKQYQKFTVRFGEFVRIQENLYGVRCYKDTEISDLYRELAMCMAEFKEYTYAYKFMSIVKVFRPESKFICGKCDEYRGLNETV